MAFTIVTAQWQGIPGAPGWTKIKFDGTLDSTAATAAANRIRNFFVSIQALLPSTASINFASVAQNFNDEGVLEAEVNISPVPAAVSGSAAGNYAAASGAVIDWLTSAFVDGRRVRGRTFLVPLATGFDPTGSLASTTVATLTTAANTLLGGTPGMVIVVRRKVTDPDGKVHYVFNGQMTVTGATVPDRAAILRSRRD